MSDAHLLCCVCWMDDRDGFNATRRCAAANGNVNNVTRSRLRSNVSEWRGTTTTRVTNERAVRSFLNVPKRVMFRNRRESRLIKVPTVW